MRHWTPGRALLAGMMLLAALPLSSCNDDDTCCVITVNVPNSVAIADVNGDAVPDLLVATTASQGLYGSPGFANVILNSASSPGTFATGTAYPSTGYNPASIAVADLTGSGALDMVVASVSGNVSVYMHGTSPGTFQAAVNLNSGGAPNQVVIADLNGDGAPDLVLADYSTSGSVIILFQDAAHPGTFMAPVQLPTGLTTASVAAADLNGDGAADLVATGYDANGNHGAVLVFLQVSAQPGTFMSPVSYPAGAAPQSVKIADLNGDGLPDLLVANFGPGSDGSGVAGVSVLLQDAAKPGTFLAPVSYQAYGGAIDVAVGDLNGDGKPDVAVASLAPVPTASISVLLQDPAHPGVLLAATSYPGFGQPLGIAIGDLNGDGLADIAAADGASATVMLQLPGKPGQFAAAVQVGQ
ncbi:MAG TPA: VCBS repeat-containing protein [Steroidobacteraceae bacterium]|nr:VCBS repeat-containing protein [Steroidobacteraceae bacterium]